MNYLIFEGIYEYSKYIFGDLNDESNCFFATPTFCGLLGKINLYHTSEKANRYFKLPFKFLWYKNYLKNIPNDHEGEWIIIFAEGCRLAYDIDFLKWLRKKYRNVKIVFYFLNSTVQLSSKRIEYIDTSFDIIVSYDKNDCKKYNWNYYCGIYCGEKQKVLEKKEENIDVFFIGRDKGRLKELLAAYEVFTNAGLKCDFYIIGVPREKQIASGIHYNKILPYEDVLNKVRNTRILFEIVQNEQSGCTFRTYEAIMYQKILVSNNLILKTMRVYDCENMILFDELSDININNLKKKKYVENGLDKKCLSPLLFLEYLERIILNEKR